MVSQGFFSPEKKRMAGEKENKPFFSVKVEPVQIANNINSYQDQTPSVRYPGDDYKDAYRKEETKSYKDSLGDKYKEAQKVADDLTGGRYDISDSPYKGLINAPSSVFDNKTRESLKTDFANEKGVISNPMLGISKEMTTKNYVADDPGIGYREGDHLSINPYKKSLMGGKITGLGVQINPFKGFDLSNKTGLGIGDTGFKGYAQKKAFGDGGMYSSDPVTQAYKNSMLFNRKELANSAIYNQIMREQNPQNYNEDGSLKTLDQKYGATVNAITEAENDFAKGLGYNTFSDYQKDRAEFSNKIQSSFDNSDKYGRPLATMPSMGISEAGREEAKLNRLQKAKEEGENKNILQRVGDSIGNVFNKLTGTEAAGAGTLQAQGINTSATTNIAQMGNVSPTVQRAREAVEKSVRQQTGMPSNPGSQRQTGVGVSANNLSRHKTGPSASRGGISRSTSSGQGGGTSSRSRGGVSRGGSRSNTGSKSSARGARGSTGSRGRGGTGTGSSRSGGTTGRSASSASKGRTGRSRSQCDIRTKIDVSPLIDSNLVKDNLAELAYFVQEIKN